MPSFHVLSRQLSQNPTKMSNTLSSCAVMNTPPTTPEPSARNTASGQARRDRNTRTRRDQELRQGQTADHRHAHEHRLCGHLLDPAEVHPHAA
jgi:hypothetical protein